MIQLAWRFLRFQKDSALAQWFQARTADGRGNTRKTEAIATGIDVDRAIGGRIRHWARSCGCRRRLRAFHARQHNTGHGSGGDRDVVRRHCHRLAW